MFAPALSSILTRLITKEGFHQMYLHPHFKGHIKDYLLLYFWPTLLLFLSGAVYFLIVPGSFDPEMTVLKGMVASSGKAGLTASSLLTTQVLMLVTIGPIVNIIPQWAKNSAGEGISLIPTKPPS
jgi:TM2 domain-containing membrane protein YozV